MQEVVRGGCAVRLCGISGGCAGRLCGEGVSTPHPVETHAFVQQNCTFCGIVITSSVYMDSESLGLEWSWLLSRHRASFKDTLQLEFMVLRDTYLRR